MFRTAILAPTLSLLLVPGSALALGLGGIHTESTLNQPFAAEIDLVGANPDELDAVKVGLASEAAFAKRGTDRQHYLTKLRFKPQISPRGKPVVRVTSTDPVREPYMDFLIEVVWPQGRLIREFTVLLDPPVSARRTTPAVERPVTTGRATPSAGAEATAAVGQERVRSVAAPAVAPPTRTIQASVPAPAGGAFPLRSAPVKSGTGLWRTARNMTPPGATVAQTAMALYRNNQDAFVQGDINRMRQGAVLQVPTSDELFALDAAKAETEFRAALAGKPVAAKPLTNVMAAASKGEARLKIASAAKPREGGMPGREPGPSGQGVQPNGDIEQELLLVRETGESTRQETDELRARVRQLEASLTDIRDLLTLRNAELDRLRGSSETATALSAPTGPVTSLSGVVLPTTTAGGQAVVGGTMEGPAGASGSAQRAEAPLMPGTVPVAEDVRGEDSSGIQPQGEPSGTIRVGDGAVAGAHKVPGGVPTEPDAAVESSGQPAKPVAPLPQTDVLQTELTDSALVELPLVGSILAYVPTPVLWSGLVAAPMLGLLVWLAVRRRRRIDEGMNELDLPSVRGVHVEGTSSIPLTLDSQDIHAGQVVEKSAPAQAGSGVANLPGPDDAADAIAEADIYIAYGRYRDAQGLLKLAIARSPHSAELHYKLAETFGNAEDYGALASLLNDMRAERMDQAHPEEWMRLIELTAGGQGPGEPQPTRADLPPALGVPVAGVGQAAQLLGSSVPAVDRTPRARGFTEDAELGIPGRVGVGEGLALDASGSLRSDEPHLEDLELDFQGIEFGQISAPGTHDAFGIAPAQGAHNGDADLELTMEDLVQATDGDLVALGMMPSVAGVPPHSVPQRMPQLGSQPALRPLAEPVSEDTSGSGFDSEVAFDSWPGAQSPETPPPDDLDLSWPELVSPARPAKGPGSETARFELGPIEPGTGASDLVPFHWQMDGGVWGEVGTKLDLGRAYVEMNDPDAAQAILAEVIEEGDADQQAEARRLLAQLTGR